LPRRRVRAAMNHADCPPMIRQVPTGGRCRRRRHVRIVNRCAGLCEVRKPSLRQATVKETVAFHRFPSAFLSGLSRERANCARNCAPSPVPKTRSAPTRQPARLVQLSGEGDGLNASRLASFVAENLRVSACVLYTCTSAVRWPSGRRRRFAKRRSAFPPSTFFLANPHVSITSSIKRFGCCWLPTPRFGSWQGQFQGQFVPRLIAPGLSDHQAKSTGPPQAAGCWRDIVSCVIFSASRFREGTSWIL
jgi:hypothetical protein